jgi:hypothetical protein
MRPETSLFKAFEIFDHTGTKTTTVTTHDRVRPQDLQTITRPDFINDIVRELTEGE